MVSAFLFVIEGLGHSGVGDVRTLTIMGIGSAFGFIEAAMLSPDSFKRNALVVR